MSTSDRKEQLGAAAYVVGGLSFIPLIGFFVGIVAVVWGVTTSRRGGKLLAAIGAGGMAFTVLLYGSLFYFGFVQRGGVYDDLRRKMAQSQINGLVPAIEFYKLAKGDYPDSLAQLAESLPKDSMLFVYDITNVESGTKPEHYFYQRVGHDNYYLRSVGQDGIPFTADDIVPKIDPALAGKIGLLIEKR